MQIIFNPHLEDKSWSSSHILQQQEVESKDCGFIHSLHQLLYSVAIKQPQQEEVQTALDAALFVIISVNYSVA